MKSLSQIHLLGYIPLTTFMDLRLGIPLDPQSWISILRMFLKHRISCFTMSIIDRISLINGGVLSQIISVQMIKLWLLQMLIIFTKEEIILFQQILTTLSNPTLLIKSRLLSLPHALKGCSLNLILIRSKLNLGLNGNYQLQHWNFRHRRNRISGLLLILSLLFKLCMLLVWSVALILENLILN